MAALSRRFEIEELVAQDAHRVVYRAVDRRTGGLVAVRRLLPRGHTGAGFDEPTTERFEAAMTVLEGINCPALRRVVAWGVDRVDRVPYIVTEWLEGERLATLLERGVLSSAAARRLAEAGLTAQAALDAAGGGWHLDSSDDTVIMTGDDHDYRFSFWVVTPPGSEAGAEVVTELAGLVERGLGWQGVLPAATAGDGLAGWLRAVRQERPTAAQALRSLARANAAAQQPPARPAPAGRSAPAAPATAAAGRRAIWWAAAACLVLVLVGGGWWFARWSHARAPGTVAGAGSAAGLTRAAPSPAATGRAGGGLDAAAASARAAELARIVAAGEATDVPARVFGPADGGLLRGLVGRHVMFKGVVREVRQSASGKSRYLEFSATRGLDDVCGRMWARDDQGLSLNALQPLVGRNIALHGKVEIEGGTGRLVIHLDTRDQIEELAPGAAPTPRPPASGAR